jgi:protein-arginine deiminase
MEAVRYAGTGFDGEITLMFRLIKGGVAGGAEQAKFRVAPWMMPSHLDAATKVFVVDAGADNRRFRRDLNGFVTGAGCTLQAHASTDIWMQDCMELGYSSIPGAGIPAVTRAPRNRPLKDFPVTLRRADFGYHEPGTLRPNTTFDSTGNLECTPPVTSEAGKRYPWGRIYYGAGRPGEEMDAELREFLQRQVVQAPIEIDTNWLAVGHVDEIISIVPAPTPKGFKLLLANPDHAYRILNNNKAAHGGSHLLVGRQFPEYRADGTFRRWHNAEVSIRRYLDHGIPHLAPDPLIQRIFNTVCQGFLDSTRAQLRTELGLTDADIIDVPILFMPNHDLPILADALTAGMVNMLVVNNHCIVPKPFGPVVGGRDLFEEDLRNNLTPLGLTVHFLDDWYEYHVNLGEVHCGTNTLRTPTRANWWEFVP